MCLGLGRWGYRFGEERCSLPTFQYSTAKRKLVTGKGKACSCICIVPKAPEPSNLALPWHNRLDGVDVSKPNFLRPDHAGLLAHMSAVNRNFDWFLSSLSAEGSYRLAKKIWLRHFGPRIKNQPQQCLIYSHCVTNCQLKVHRNTSRGAAGTSPILLYGRVLPPGDSN